MSGIGNDRTDFPLLVIQLQTQRQCTPIDSEKRSLHAAGTITKAAYFDRSICRMLSVSLTHCWQSVQDRPTVYMEVEQECWVDISISTFNGGLSTGATSEPLVAMAP